MWRGLPFLAFFLLYVASATLGLQLKDFAKGNATLVWPPSGLSLAVLLLAGRRFWPAITAGAFTANALTGVPLWVAAAISVGNTLEAVLASELLRRGNFRRTLDHLPDLLPLVIFAAMGCTVISASVGAASLWLGGAISWADVPVTWGIWWVGDMLSILVLTPLILSWAVPASTQPASRSRVEAIALGGCLVATSVLVLVDPFRLGLGRYSLAFLLVPGHIWSALRFGPRGVTASTLVVSLVAIWSTGGELALLAEEQSRSSLLLLQIFILVFSVTGLVLGAAVAGHRRSEQERLKLVEQLREAVRARDEFLSVASHELRTPLTSLSLQVDGFQRRLRDGHFELAAAPISRLLENTTRQVQRLSRLIDALLDVSRIATGRLLLEPAEVPLAGLVREVVERHQPELERVKCQVGLELEEGVVGRWDRMRLEQVLANLLTNAMKFGAGGPIDLSVRRLGRRAELRVKDHGIGIGVKDQARIFERFERAVSSREFGGLGLGLYISRQIVQEHGGEIRVDSVPGQGSTFSVELPLSSLPSGR